MYPVCHIVRHKKISSNARLLPSSSFDARRCGAMLWCEPQLCWVLVWRYAVLCPAFQWLLSKHTQRWKPFLLTHAVNEALFCRTAAETQRAGPSGWSLCLLCTQIWHKKKKKKNKKYQLSRCTDYVQIILYGVHAGISQQSPKRQITGWEDSDMVGWSYLATKNAISNSQSIVPFYRKGQLIFFLFLVA